MQTAVRETATPALEERIQNSKPSFLKAHRSRSKGKATRTVLTFTSEADDALKKHPIMPAVPVLRPPVEGSRLPPWLRTPPPAAKIVAALLVIGSIIGLRILAAWLLPTYIWSRDSGSYVTPATTWLETGRWITSARRGPVYSLFLAAIFRVGGTLATVATVQAVIGGLTAFLTLGMARAWLGRRAFWPLAVCSLLYAVYGMPIEIERLIRNEALLTFFATLAFGGWFVALRTGKTRWFALSGLATGLMQLLKGIFPIFPLIVVVLTAWNWRRQPTRAASLIACYLVLAALPLAVSKIYDRASGTGRAPEPEAGEMFYGRTAQWTVLDGGIEPAVKARIHDQAAAYAERFRRTGKLDNNEIVKRTVIPTIKTVVVDEGHRPPADVDRLCWRLGLEAVEHHPGAYLKQVGHDFFTLNFITAQRFIIFLPDQLNAATRDAKKFVSNRLQDNHAAARIFDVPASQAAIRQGVRPHSGLIRLSRFATNTGRLRLLSPVFLTTLLLPVLVWFVRGRERLFWMGNTILWYYYLVLLSTVGRPLDRYLMPVLPLMFWTASTGANAGWQWILRKYGVKPLPAA